MRNIWIICRKELRSYFVSPIAYLLLTMFAVIFGFFFWNSLGYFVIRTMEAQMSGQTFPVNLNEYLIRPLLSNVSVIGRSEEHTSELQSHSDLVCRLLLEKKNVYT